MCLYSQRMQAEININSISFLLHLFGIFAVLLHIFFLRVTVTILFLQPSFEVYLILQYWVSFSCTAEWFSCVCVCLCIFFLRLFSIVLLQDIEYSSLFVQ